MRASRSLSFLLIPAAGLIATTLSSAAGAVGQEEASPTGKGIVGGALLGAELVLVIEAAIDVEPTWAYIAGGLAGAAGGGVGGYFIEQTGDAKASMALLALGMAFAIPTTVAVLSATAYEPPEEWTQDQGPSDEPVAEPPQPAEDLAPPSDNLETPPASTAPVEGKLSSQPKIKLAHIVPRRPLGPALVDTWSNGALALSVPALRLNDVFSDVEQHVYGVAHETELNVALFNFNF